MRIYTAHIDPLSPLPDAGAVLLRDGFNWAAFIIGLFWSLWHRLWWVSALLLGIEFAVAGLATLLIDPALVIVLRFAVAVFVGASANDWRRWTMRRRGWREVGVVFARDRDAAEHRFLTNLSARGTL